MTNKIKVYGWHPITKEALGCELYADESPLEAGIYHMPQYTTDKPVPNLGKNQCALYDDEFDEWRIVADYRGQTMYSITDGSPAVVDSLGDTPASLTSEPRPSSAYDWNAKKQAWVENKVRAAEIAAKIARDQASAAIESVSAALQAAIDSRAKSMGFSSGNAVILYAGFANAFTATAQTFGAWEAQVWVEAGKYKAEVMAGTKPMVSPAEAVAMMPAYPSTTL